MSVKIVYGDEPYIIDKMVEDEKKDIIYPEMNINYFDEYSDAVKSAVETLPIVDDKRVVILSLAELKGDDDLLKLLKSVPESTDFIIVSKDLDKRTTLYKYAKNEKMLKECCKLTDPQLKKFIYGIVEKSGAKITNYDQLSKRINYHEDPNISLYTVEIYIMQLLFLSPIITENEIMKVIPYSSNEKVFELSKALLSGRADKTFSLALDFLDRGENPIGMLSLMLRTFRLAYKASLYSDFERKEIGALLGVPIFQFQDALHIPEDSLSRILDLIQAAINGIKNGRCDANTMFLLAIGNIFTTIYPSKQATACNMGV